MGLFGFLTGMLIIVSFIGCAQFLRMNEEGKKYHKFTMSNIASNPKYTNGVRFFCWTVSLLTIPYVYSLVNVFDLPWTSLTVLIGIPASIGLFFTALTINLPDGHVHNIASFVFYISLWLMPIDLAIRFIVNNQHSIIGGYLVLGALGVVLLTIVNFFRTRKREDATNGITEIVFMGGNAFWVITFSILMLVN